ncbi:MAG: hypothetical protein R3Y44_04365 [Rikenellaceae bacterium]
MRKLLLTYIFILTTSTICAQSIGIGYYDLDRLYDTIPSRFYDDSHFTPEGKYHWNTERYNQKVSHSAALLDSMRLPIIGLYGIENEAVVRDIVARCQQDYSYIHRTRNSLDGMDFALLYFGDQLYIDRVEALRNMLVVEAMIASSDSPITIILTLSGEDTYIYIGRNRRIEDTFVVILGSLYQNHISKLGFSNIMERRERRGEGNMNSERGWIMRDRAATNQSQRVTNCGVYITPWLLTRDMQSPLPTFDRYSYVGGYSRYLPIFIYCTDSSQPKDL